MLPPGPEGGLGAKISKTATPQFTVRWVGEGQNTMGSRLTGSSCEAAWTFNKGKACHGCRGLFRPDEVLECSNCAKTFCGTCMDAERVCRGCDGSEDE